MKLDTLRKTASLAGGLRLLFFVFAAALSGILHSGKCRRFVQWRAGFFCVKDDCGFVENVIKSRVLFRSMEQCSLFL